MPRPLKLFRFVNNKALGYNVIIMQGTNIYEHAAKCPNRVSLLSGVPDYFDRNKISSGGDLSHYSSASLY